MESKGSRGSGTLFCPSVTKGEVSVGGRMVCLRTPGRRLRRANPSSTHMRKRYVPEHFSWKTSLKAIDRSFQLSSRFAYLPAGPFSFSQITCSFVKEQFATTLFVSSTTPCNSCMSVLTPPWYLAGRTALSEAGLCVLVRLRRRVGAAVELFPSLWLFWMLARPRSGDLGPLRVPSLPYLVAAGVPLGHTASLPKTVNLKPNPNPLFSRSSTHGRTPNSVNAMCASPPNALLCHPPPLPSILQRAKSSSRRAIRTLK